ILKKINIWVGYLSWARRAIARPVNTLLSSEQQRKHRQEKLCSAHASKTQIPLELLGPSYRPHLVQFSRLFRHFKKEYNSEWNDFEYKFLDKKPSPNFELSRQDLYVRVEAPKGELGIYLVGDDSLFPWRWKIRPPGFINLQFLPQLVKKMKLADIMTILGSIDIIMGEVDH
uniref:NAD(P)H dehydrogenase subunit H n=1 Tax=Aegilops tauschii subsp. strangulata TaxID=200361 RepID=A0A453LG34_AEGTS